ncbi:DUF4830 domain-containing protein [Litchfieldia alkalitelluris]|uniref:DUF4830 domain-containing protein n=1 Tax=Litchfieldia alkalitelluris TaxID=304268 RepID=UPI001472E474|nr:DUF4830 domain-containing protein [Litchfieldia alkalitelluris]
MKGRIIVMLVIGLFISGCGSVRLNEEHDQYLSDKGWEIKELTEERTYLLDIPDELLSNYEASGITFLNEYLGKEVTTYSYELKDKDIEGERLKAFVYEVEGEIIGGYGVLPSWTPGRFNLDDKERLVNEEMIKSK